MQRTLRVRVVRVAALAGCRLRGAGARDLSTAYVDDEDAGPIGYMSDTHDMLR